MQIRKQGGSIQLIRSTYDPAKKRCVQKLVASIRRTGEVSADLVTLLSDDEQKQVKAFLAAEDEARIDHLAHTEALQAANTIERLATAEVQRHLKADQAADLWRAIGALQKALRKSGIKRPTKTTPAAQ